MNNLPFPSVNLKIKLLLFVFICLLVKGFGQEITKEMDVYLQAHAKNRYFSGAVLVAKNNEIIFRKGYGFANDEKRETVQSETKFRIASLTKSFTAMAIMQLEEQGKLSLDDPVKKFVPDYARGDEISLFQVLHHTAGIPDFLNFPAYWEKLQDSCSVDQAVEIFKDEPLRFPPGSRWEYSNSGYVLLGFIIEKITGQSLADYFESNIFEPLEMNNTGWESESPIESFGATGYQLEGNNRMSLAPVNMSVNHGAGALFSTIDDLYKWDRGLYTEKLLSKKGMEKIFTPHLNAYGGGWGIMNHQRFGKSFIFMNGRFSGFAANISRYPKDDLCVIVLSNLMDIDPRIIADNLAAIVFGELVIPPSKRKRIDVPLAKLEQYVGTFVFEKMNPPLEIEIMLDTEGKLIRKISGRPDKVLIPSTDSVFYYEEADVDIVFEQNENGAFNYLLMNLLGTPFEGIRI